MEMNLGIKYEWIDNILYFSMNNIHEFLIGTRPSGELKNNQYIRKVSGSVLIGRKQGYVYGVTYQNLNAFIKTLKRADENKIKFLKAYADYIYRTSVKTSVEKSENLKEKVKALKNKERALEEENSQLKKIIVDMKSVLETIETT